MSKGRVIVIMIVTIIVIGLFIFFRYQYASAPKEIVNAFEHGEYVGDDVTATGQSASVGG